MAGVRVGFTTVILVVLTGVAEVDPCAEWRLEGSICAWICPCWDRGADSGRTIGFSSEPGAVSALLEGEEESGGEGSLEAPPRSEARAAESLSLSLASWGAYLGEDVCRDSD